MASSRATPLSSEARSTDRPAGTSPFVELLLDETRNEIDRADSKASIMLGGAGATIASLVGVLLAAEVRAAQVPSVAWLLATATATSFVLSVGVLAAAVYPRIGKGTYGRARYFVEYAQYRDVDELSDAVAGELDDIVGRHLQQLGVLSVIARTKYRLTIVGEWAAAVGYIAAGLTAFAFFAGQPG
jgi:hypothetical protein